MHRMSAFQISLKSTFDKTGKLLESSGKKK